MKRIVNEPTEIDGFRVIQDTKEMEEALKRGESFYHWEFGNSLTPLIKNREYCFVKPCTPSVVKRGDCVFCVIENEYGDEYPMIHQVWEISDASHTDELWFKIGSTSSTVFGWTKQVYGIAKGTNIFQELTPKFEKFLKNQLIEA